jgi:hypothetical protein
MRSARSSKKFLYSWLLLTLICVGIGLSMRDINFSDGAVLTRWALERIDTERTFTTFLDYYWLVGADDDAALLFFNLSLISVIILSISKACNSNFSICLFFTSFAVLTPMVTKEIFFLLGVWMLFGSTSGRTTGGILFYFFMGCYLLLITRPALGAIYIFCYVYTIAWRGEFGATGIMTLILVCFLLTLTPQYDSYYDAYFITAGPETISASAAGTGLLNFALRFVANLFSPIFALTSLTGFNDYKLYVLISTCAIWVRLAGVQFTKEANSGSTPQVQTGFFYSVLITVSMLIPFVQVRYILPAGLTLFMLGGRRF